MVLIYNPVGLPTQFYMKFILFRHQPSVCKCVSVCAWQAQYIFLHQSTLELLNNKGNSQSIWFVSYSALEKMDSLDAMEGKHTRMQQHT